MTETKNKFLPMRIKDTYALVGEYDEFDIIEAEHCMEEPVLRVTYYKNDKLFYELLFKIIENLKERLEYLKKEFNTPYIYPAFEMMYCPFIWHATEDEESREQIVLFVRFLDKNYKLIDFQKINKLFPEEYYNPCISREYNILPEIVGSYNSYIPNSLKIDFDRKDEEEFIKFFNYLFFLKTEKTCYEEMLEHSFMQEGWFPEEPEDIWDITSLKGVVKLRVSTLQRLHRQTLTHYNDKKCRIYINKAGDGMIYRK